MGVCFLIYDDRIEEIYRIANLLIGFYAEAKKQEAAPLDYFKYIILWIAGMNSSEEIRIGFCGYLDGTHFLRRITRDETIYEFDLLNKGGRRIRRKPELA